jgi:hypothetical protein
MAVRLAWRRAWHFRNRGRSVSLVVAGSVAGLGIAALRLWAKFHGVRERQSPDHARASI